MTSKLMINNALREAIQAIDEKELKEKIEDAVNQEKQVSSFELYILRQTLVNRYESKIEQKDSIISRLCEKISILTRENLEMKQVLKIPVRRDL